MIRSASQQLPSESAAAAQAESAPVGQGLSAASSSAPAAVAAVADRDRLRAAGLRSTPARLAVLQVLDAAEAALSHADLVDRLGQERWDPATLYRNLCDLVRVGLARRVDVGDHVWRFEPRSQHDPSSHPHFTCTECGSTQCLPDLQWQPPEPAPRALQRQQVEVQIKGVCDDCG